MIIEKFSGLARSNKEQELNCDFVVVGGGLAGVCAAISAARAGSKVVLVQDRPVLGGNASSEVRLWALGATSHMGNNNRWSREGGVIDEIMLENLKRNKDGNALIFDTVLLDKIYAEENITLLLNTSVYQVNKKDENNISSVEAFCSQNSIHYKLSAPIFCDASGDGVMAFGAGAAFRIGAEAREEFGELLANEEPSQDLLGHSLFFYSKRMDKPVSYTAPEFAYKHEDIAAIPRCKNIHGDDSGCKFWWLEYGGILDTIHQSEDIKFELWKIVYGIWDYIKNSGKFEDVENLTLEWVGTVPGKRESRRFEGQYMLKQQDIVEQTQFDDAVSYGGWAIDIHPSEGIYSDKPACSQFHSKGVYQIPYRCFVSRDIENLYLAGRIISASHMAFGSTRVMITCAHGGQAVGEAAALCVEKELKPVDLLATDNMAELQQRLMINGQGLAGVALDTSNNLVAQASLSASSTLALAGYTASSEFLSLEQSIAQLVPLSEGQAPSLSLSARADEGTSVRCELRISSKAENYTPDVTLAVIELELEAGEQNLHADFSGVELAQDAYAFICFMANDKVQLATSEQLITGTMSVLNKVHKAVSNDGKQRVPENSGLEEFEFWTPERRPKGQNLALQFTPALNAFELDSLKNGHLRPWLKSNAWVADFSDKQPKLELRWPQPVELKGLKLFFDTDSDHALETVLMQHPETQIPYCVQNYRVLLADGSVVCEKRSNYQSINTQLFDKPINTDYLAIELEHPSATVPAALFELHIL
ncbi:FAD-dependent oxidoreductase [Agaribacterium sp. ZY112]|uniref:FAD-dependent oxidoreductase n=1 Tax=Agaribacterium sp. ZY112 TaxID=3233574 RepID=UPI003524A150